jgi:hypothetical protein
MGAAATVVNGTMMGKSASRERISVRRMMVAYGIGVYPTTIHIVT